MRKRRRKYAPPTITGHYIDGVLWKPEDTYVVDGVRKVKPDAPLRTADVATVAIPRPTFGAVEGLDYTVEDVEEPESVPTPRKRKRIPLRRTKVKAGRVREAKSTAPDMVKQFCRAYTGNKTVKPENVFVGRVIDPESTNWTDAVYIAYGKGKKAVRDYIAGEAVPPQVWEWISGAEWRPTIEELEKNCYIGFKQIFKDGRVMA
jgi:hypothetical protein